jgi:hypothetical protein
MGERMGRVLLMLCSSALALAACDPQGAVQSFHFELLDWRCGHATVRTPTVAIEAQGEFCYVAMNIENRGAAAASLDPSCQFMLDEGTRYAPQLQAVAADHRAVAGFGDPIAPGEIVENSALYFDVPKGSEPDRLELHETCGGPGIDLDLRADSR